MKYIPSLLNYTGGKFRILPQVLSLFPQEFSVLVEPFCGSCVIALNTQHEFVICNDKCQPLIQLYQYLQQADIDVVVGYIQSQKTTFSLSKYNKNAYLRFREYYNNTKHILDLLILLYHSFNNNIRFNKEHNFTCAFGERTFTKNHEDRLRHFMRTIKSEQWEFSSVDFRDIDIITWSQEYFAYFDPPYTNSNTTYMDFLGWRPQDDLDLFKYIDKLNERGIRFALSNTLVNKGVRNFFLENWARKYRIYPIDSNYSGASYQRLDRMKSNTVEVLVTNYEPPEQPIQESLF